MTFSVLGRDRALIGAVAASHSVGVGSRVLWGRAGVGVVATQAVTRTEYGTELLDLLESGLGVEAALRRCVARDRHRAHRQVAVLAADGSSAQFSGPGCLDVVEEAGGADGCAQGNTLRTPDTGAAMMRALGRHGTLTERLLAALQAGEDAGGDQRGTRSASLLVVDGSTVLVNLRVDDHPDPVPELFRLHAESVLQQHVAAAQRFLLGYGGDPDDLIAGLSGVTSTARQRDADRMMWLGLLLMATGDRPGGVRAIRAAIDRYADLPAMLLRVVRKGGLSAEVLHELRHDDVIRSVMEA